MRNSSSVLVLSFFCTYRENRDAGPYIPGRTVMPVGKTVIGHGENRD
jgi:hypothetical protein